MDLYCSNWTVNYRYGTPQTTVSLLAPSDDMLAELVQTGGNKRTQVVQLLRGGTVTHVRGVDATEVVFSRVIAHPTPAVAYEYRRTQQLALKPLCDGLLDFNYTGTTLNTLTNAQLSYVIEVVVEDAHYTTETFTVTGTEVN